VGRLRNSLNSHASDPAISDHFGGSVSLYGETALIGAYGDNDNGKTDSGSMYVFTRSSTDDGTFMQQSKLHASDAEVERSYSVDPRLSTTIRR